MPQCADSSGVDRLEAMTVSHDPTVQMSSRLKSILKSKEMDPTSRVSV